MHNSEMCRSNALYFAVCLMCHGPLVNTERILKLTVQDVNHDPHS